MNFLSRHRLPKRAWTVGTGGENHRLRLLQDEIDRLYRSRRLLGQNGAEGGHLLEGAGNGLFAPVPDRQARRNNDDDEQSYPGKREVSAGAKMPALEAVDFHHAATLAGDAYTDFRKFLDTSVSCLRPRFDSRQQL